MRSLIQSLAMAVLALALAAIPVQAQATRTWVSGVGDDVNPCSRTAPCKTFAGAISKTAAGGEISVLDPGGFGALTITKSLTLYNDGAVGSILAAGTNGILINAAATDRIVIDGLEIDGAGTGLNGIRIINAGSVIVKDTVVRNFRGGTGFGIDIQSASPIEVYLQNVTIMNCLGGVNVSSAGVINRVTIDGSHIVQNASFSLTSNGASARAVINGSVFRGAVNDLVSSASGKINSLGTNLVGTGDPTTVTALK